MAKNSRADFVFMAGSRFHFNIRNQSEGRNMAVTMLGFGTGSRRESNMLSACAIFDSEQRVAGR